MASVSRDRLDAAAATMQRLLEIHQTQIHVLERELDRMRKNVRDLSLARADARRAVKVLGQALEWLTTAAATVPRKGRYRPRPSGKPN